MSGVGAHHTASQRHSSFSLLLFIILGLSPKATEIHVLQNLWFKSMSKPRNQRRPRLATLSYHSLHIHSHLSFYVVSGQKQLWWCHQWCPLLWGEKKDSSLWQWMSVINLRVLGKPAKLASLWLTDRYMLLALEGIWVLGGTAMCMHSRSWRMWNFILSLNI